LQKHLTTTKLHPDPDPETLDQNPKQDHHRNLTCWSRSDIQHFCKIS